MKVKIVEKIANWAIARKYRTVLANIERNGAKYRFCLIPAEYDNIEYNYNKYVNYTEVNRPWEKCDRIEKINAAIRGIIENYREIISNI